MGHPRENRIPLDQCKDRALYLVHSRNLKLAVYCERDKSFYGLRRKFGSVFIDNEYHWDTGAPYGTASPMFIIDEELPADIDFPPIPGSDKRELHAWVSSMEKKHADKIPPAIGWDGKPLPPGGHRFPTKE